MKAHATALLLMALVGCGQATPASSQQNEAPVFKVESPQKKTLRPVLDQPGQLIAIEETPIFARLTGYVGKVLVDIGDPVKAEQVLAEILVPEMDEELKLKKAMVDQAEAAYQSADARVATAQAMVKEAEAGRIRTQANYDRWASEFKRIDDLVKQKVIDVQARDETLNQFRSAESTRAELEAKVLSLQAAARESDAKRNQAKADIAAAKAERDRLAALLQYAKVQAPFDGVVTRRNVHKGHFLQPNSAANAVPLFIVTRMDILRVVVEVPEMLAPLVKDGLPTRIRVASIKNRDFEGKVTRSAWSLESKAQTLRTEIHLANPDGVLRPGMYAYVTFEPKLEDRWTLPPAAVVAQGESAFCWRLVEGKAVKTPIRLGQRSKEAVEGQPDRDIVEVLQKQVGSGKSAKWEPWDGSERVITGALAALTDGQEVKVAQ